MLSSDFVWHSNEKLKRANHSLERTQPQRDFMYDVEVLRRSARGRYGAKRIHDCPSRSGYALARIIACQP